jgi:stage II sporulation protein D
LATVGESKLMLRRALVFVFVVPFLLTGGALAQQVAGRAPQAAAPKPGAFFISGRGWGHGVGLSQWGAYGFAQRGTGYERILAHYYRGTTLGRAPVARVRVLLADGKKSVAIKSGAPFRVRDATAKTYQLPAGTYAFGPGLRLKVDPAKNKQPLAGPIVFSPGSAPLEYSGRAYRGQIQINVGSGRVQVVNNVGLEPYLYGVVPREVPNDWPTEALKAQAVVARSYALAVRKTGAFDLYADTRSQVYGGIAAEKPTTNAAVDATAGQVLMFNGKVATTFFFSTSGGRTANVQDAWRGGVPTPYLVSVNDPYDGASPHHTWGPFPFTAARLQKAFRVPGRLVDVRVAVNPSQRVSTVTFVNQRGDEIVVSGSDVRTRLNLRSTWFRFGVLSLTRPTKPVDYGTTARLTGQARGSSAVTLEQRAGAVWEPAARLKPARDGTVTAVVRPLVTTDYRLTSATLSSTPIRVTVAPRVRLHQVTQQTALTGVARPIIVGARVEIQRLSGSSWRLVARTVLDERGEFEARLELVAGTYRARVIPGRGLVPGFSPELKVLTG